MKVTAERINELCAKGLPLTPMEQLEWNLATYDSMIERTVEWVRGGSDPSLCVHDRDEAVRALVTAVRNLIESERVRAPITL